MKGQLDVLADKLGLPVEDIVTNLFSAEGSQLRTPLDDMQLAWYKTAITSFGKYYDLLYSRLAVTPYVHMIYCHSYALLKEHRSLRWAANEGFEAAHKRNKQLYRLTQRGDDDRLRGAP